MGLKRAIGAARGFVVAGAVTAVLFTATACGEGRSVTFAPAANTSAGGLTTSGRAGVPAAAAAAGPASPGAASGSVPAAGRIPPNLQIIRHGSTVCVRDTRTGSEACVSGRGTAVANGVLVVDGTVMGLVASSGLSGASVAVTAGGAYASAGAGLGAAAAAGIGGAAAAAGFGAAATARTTPTGSPAHTSSR